MKNLVVIKSNRVIEASYKLTLIEQKVLSTCVAQISHFKSIDSTDGFEVSVNDLASLSAGQHRNEYRDLKIAAERLLTRIVTINNPFPSEKRVTQLKTHWVSSVAYIPEEATVRLYFASPIIPYLSQISKEFTQYNLIHIGQMSSTYGIRLYELLMQWKSTGKREVELDWFRQCLQLEKKYSSIKDFKLYVIDPAVSDINTHSNYNVSWTQRKTGRRVTHFTFTFTEKNPVVELPVKNKAIKKVKEETIQGITKAEIEKQARPGESYEQAALRIMRENLKGVKS